jgi:hypothetical protein
MQSWDAQDFAKKTRFPRFVLQITRISVRGLFTRMGRERIELRMKRVIGFYYPERFREQPRNSTELEFRFS